MNSALVVSTECPTCGAPLDFSEGSNAVQCLHCRSHLLVTGRKQTLSYVILPKIDDKEALKRVRMVQGDHQTPPRMVKAQLYFIPYYRLTGHDFFWEKTDTPFRTASIGGFSSIDCSEAIPKSGVSSIGIIQAAVNLFHFFRSAEEKEPFLHTLSSGPAGLSRKGAAPIKAVISGTGPGDDEEVVFRDRYIEKNFIACHLDGLGLYSLGVRPAVLRLTLFQREVLEKQGKIVGAALAPDGALAHGLKGADSEKIVRRQVIGRILSVIYFPFWVIEMEKKGEGRLQIVDAVSERVIQLDAPLSTYDGLDQCAPAETAVIGFRPLVCPNCGWDLPGKPDDVIFLCTSCEKAWQIRGSDLRETVYTIADAGPLSEPVKYLPFWVVEAEGEKGEKASVSFRYFIPAFRCRRLKILSDLAGKISQKQPAYSILSFPRNAKLELHGCYYDQDDGAMLAKFLHAGSNEKLLKEPDKRPLNLKNATLTWFPFEERAGGLIDPFTGFSLPKNLLM